MEKRLRSSLKTSAEDFLTSATKLRLKSAKPSLKALICNLTSSSSLTSSLPLSLHHSISQSITRFNELSRSSNADPACSPPSPPAKRPRRSSRKAKNSDDSATTGPEAKLVNEKQCVIQQLQIYTYLALLCVSHPKKVFSPSDMLPGVRELHDNLILFESDSILCSEIGNLCEEWWKEELPGREALISQFLPYLLSRSLTLQKKVDVHRVYALREAFTLFDFEDESIEDLKLLLIRCLIAPLYLKTEDGRKFIAFMFGLSGQLMKEAFAMIRSQIPFDRKSITEAYADIVFRAWKAAEGVVRDELENGFLPGLIEGAIHASSASLAASIRRILGGFFTQRTTNGVEKLLFRLAEPVIFRSLQVANSNVRQNALHLLLDMFPLEDPDSTKEVKDTLHDKQFFLLERLLMDECPDVRAIAVEGSCRILHLFWEIIPSSTITKIITKVFDDMTYDSCSEVRLSTVNGITYLLDNPQSHDILKVLLPKLGHLIHDNPISIRAALIELLLLLRDIRTFQFHKVVHLDALLSTLANDQPLIAQKITKLLMPSYFPLKVTVREACNRCITLIKRSPRAGARFCEFLLLEGATLQSLLELLKVLISLALSPINLHGDQIDGLLVAAAYLCKHLASEASYKDILKELLSGENLRCLFLAAASRRAQSSVCDIISSISPCNVDGLFEECMALVTSCCDLSENMERQNEVRSVHKMMLSCNQFDEMLEALTGLLWKTVYGCHTKFGIDIQGHKFSVNRTKIKSLIKISTKQKHVTGRKFPSTAASFEDDYSIAIGIAWQIKDLLTVESTRKAMLESQMLDLAFLALKVISEVSILQCTCCDYMHATPILAYTGLALHMSLRNIGTGSANKQGTNKSTCDSAGSSWEPTFLERTMDLLFDCTNKLFEADDSGKSGKLPRGSNQDRNKAASRRQRKKIHSETDTSDPGDAGSIFTKHKRISNTLKILTAVLKFVVDAAAIEPVHHNRQRCLKFTLDYLKFVTTNLRQYSCDKQQFEEENLKETILCLKSCFTYAAKLVNLSLASSNEALPLPMEAHDLANSLLDLIITIELYLGTCYAARAISAIKPWLPDIVLALGYRHLLKQTTEGKDSDSPSNQGSSTFPLWPSILSKMELSELSEVGSDEEIERVHVPVEFPAFKKLIEVMVLMLRRKTNILDAVGMVFLTGTTVGLEREDFELVFGLIHFVCGRLVRHKDEEWDELNLMLAFLRELYPRMERTAKELSHNEEGRQLLQSALVLVEPVWTTYVYCTQKDTMEEQ